MPKLDDYVVQSGSDRKELSLCLNVLTAKILILFTIDPEGRKHQCLNSLFPWLPIALLNVLAIGCPTFNVHRNVSDPIFNEWELLL